MELSIRTMLGFRRSRILEQLSRRPALLTPRYLYAAKELFRSIIIDIGRSPNFHR